MARKTKKEKLLAELRRLKVIAKQKEDLGKGIAYSIEGTKTTFAEPKVSDREKPEEQKVPISQSIPKTELSPILKDLRKIIFLTAIFIGLQIILYLTLLRNL